jgi:hypothetical protein
MQKTSTDTERHLAHHHNGDTESLARLLTDVLTRVREDSSFRPPPLGPKALAAIAAYEVMSAALNPLPATVFTDSNPARRAK